MISLSSFSCSIALSVYVNLFWTLMHPTAPPTPPLQPPLPGEIWKLRVPIDDCSGKEDVRKRWQVFEVTRILFAFAYGRMAAENGVHGRIESSWSRANGCRGLRGHGRRKATYLLPMAGALAVAWPSLSRYLLSVTIKAGCLSSRWIRIDWWGVGLCRWIWSSGE